MTFVASLGVWVLGNPHAQSYVAYRNTSYLEDFIALSPIATIIFAFLAVGLWIVWWRGRSG